MKNCYMWMSSFLAHKENGNAILFQFCTCSSHLFKIFQFYEYWRKVTSSKPWWTIGRTIGVTGERTMRLAIPHFNRLIGASSWDTFPSGKVCSCSLKARKASGQWEKNCFLIKNHGTIYIISQTLCLLV